MRILEPGHVYELSSLDGTLKQTLTFVNRGLTPGAPIHPGTQNQDVLKITIDVLEAVIDRVNQLDSEKSWESNPRIIKALTDAQRLLRLSILYHEERALEQKVEKNSISIENLPLGDDGHILLEKEFKRISDQIDISDPITDDKIRTTIKENQLTRPGVIR